MAQRIKINVCVLSVSKHPCMHGLHETHHGAVLSTTPPHTETLTSSPASKHFKSCAKRAWSLTRMPSKTSPDASFMTETVLVFASVSTSSRSLVRWLPSGSLSPPSTPASSPASPSHFSAAFLALPLTNFPSGSLKRSSTSPCITTSMHVCPRQILLAATSS